MAAMTGASAKNKWRAWATLCLFSTGLAACGGGSNETAGSPELALAATTISGSATTYSVVNLSAGDSSGVINATGQVAFFRVDDGQGSFYDGSAIRGLGTLGGAAAYPTAINRSGQVAGYADPYPASGQQHAFLWSATSGMTDLGTFDGMKSTAYAINDAGQVAGCGVIASGYCHAFRWTPTGGMVDLGTLGGRFSNASGINGAGQIAGYSDTNPAFSHPHAFLWTLAGGMTDLGTVGDGMDYFTQAINSSAQAVGYAFNASGYKAFSWTATGGMVDMGTLGGTNSSPYTLNDSGQVVGYADTTSTASGSGNMHAFSWTLTGGMVDLGLFGGTFSSAQDINGSGQIVGISDTAGGVPHAFVWTKAVGMVDLNTRIPTAPAGLELHSALAISDNGSILASSNVGLVLLKPDATGTAAPTVGPISATDPVAVGRVVAVSARFTDADAADTHTATWSWGDGGNDQAGAVAENNGSGSATGTHTYKAAGVYSVGLKVTDNSGRTAEVRRDVVVYDPSAGFVAGAGWIMSPPGAYKKDAGLAGRATFGFVSRYLRGETKPTGATEFQFHAANLNFHSNSSDWLVVAGARAQYQGSGTVNNSGGYKFMLTAVDGAGPGGRGKDRFRIRIWHHDTDTNADAVVYDNQIDAGAEGTTNEGTVIGGGSIVIHR